jgi:hypothetical protein
MNIISTQKILITFIGITFINVTFAFDGWFSPDQVRCKVEYTRMNLVTGVEVRKKHTSQGDLDELGNCWSQTYILGQKVEDWIRESSNNILVDMSAMYCKTRTDDGIFSNVWTKYKQCHAGDSATLLSWAADLAEEEGQIGYNANFIRLKGLVWEEGGVYNEPYDD